MTRSENPAGYGVIPDEIKRTMTGLELLTRVMNGELPPPPIQQTLEFRLTKVERGATVFTGVPKRDYYNPLGTVHGGYITALLDSCMSCAVHSTLAAGYTYATLEVKINFVRGITGDTGELRAEGTVVHTGKRIATAAGQLLDTAGKIYAHGTTTCFIFTL